jgi:hypothetical protein
MNTFAMPDDATVLVAGSFTKANAAHPAHKLDAQPSEEDITSRSLSAPAARRGFVSPSASHAEFFLHAAYAERRRTLCRSGARF